MTEKTQMFRIKGDLVIPENFEFPWLFIRPCCGQIFSKNLGRIYTQKQLSTKVDLANLKLLTSTLESSSEREMARINSLGLPHAGAWLNCPPTLGLQ